MKIPSDIMVKAEALYDALGRGSDADAQVIARAILAERRRCADCCARAGSPEWSDETNGGYDLAAREIKEAIEAGT